jgi:hypothetical protein
MKILKLVVLFFLLFPSLAFAQAGRNPCYYTVAPNSTSDGCTAVSKSNPLPIYEDPQSPAGTSFIQGNATSISLSVAATLTSAVGKTAFLCDFDVSAVGGSATVGPITVAGLLGGSKIYQLFSSATGVFLNKNFRPCLPASATNTNITITTTTDGTATAVDVNSDGILQ